jgi:TonB family protein
MPSLANSAEKERKLGCICSIAMTVAALAVFLSGIARAQAASEYQVKAAYLFNFAKLTEWRAASADSALVIAVLGGDDGFVDVLRSTLAGKSVNGRPVVIKRARSATELRSGQVIYFRGSLRDTRLAMAEGDFAGALLVGEDPDFLAAGGMINLLLRNGRVSYEVNPEAMARAGVRFGAAAGAPVQAKSLEDSSTRRVRSQVAAVMPDVALRMGLTGAVQLRAVVKPDGSVQSVKILGGHPLLAAAAADAVMKWHFEPGPRETIEIVKIDFIH